MLHHDRRTSMINLYKNKRHKNNFYRFAVILGAVFMMSFMGVVPAMADREAAYTVRDVAIDVTAEDAAQARELALIQGQRAAYRRLVSRLTLDKDFHKRPPLDDAAIAELVQGIEIESEKTSPIRYIANLTVSFKPEAVQELLGGYGVSFSEVMSEPIVVIPVYEENGERFLWEDSSPWLSAWRDHVSDSAVVPMVLPLADLADFSVMTPERALRGDRSALEKITRRYDVTDALVVHARFIPGKATRKHHLDIALSRYGPAVTEKTRRFRVTAEPGEERKNLLERSVAQVVNTVEVSWKIGGLRQADDRPNRLKTVVPLRELADWIKIEKDLTSVPLVQKTVMISFSRRRALIDIHFFGTVAKLVTLLAQSGLFLRSTDSGWSLSRQKYVSPG